MVLCTTKVEGIVMWGAVDYKHVSLARLIRRRPRPNAEVLPDPSRDADAYPISLPTRSLKYLPTITWYGSVGRET